MQQKTELDCIFINSYLKYKNLGDSKDLIEQAAFWIGRIAVRKYSLSEDERSEVLLKFIQKIEYFSKIYETGKFENFSAFAIVFLKHLVLNQWKKKINSLKRKPIFWNRIVCLDLWFMNRTMIVNLLRIKFSYKKFYKI
ncbi:hypothetical protein LEP1GSC037_0750 [Leptospira interrogans str. 2006001854]|uniref:Sigma-70 region 2 n=1 Tax=Leptospira interrogans str. 2006001854 TaxID=1001590 RepID=M6GAB0_LEPIR|nr:hypothetical protein LEP1GSC037_0750 [Leptospira interrogans str. 2006001854]